MKLRSLQHSKVVQHLPLHLEFQLEFDIKGDLQFYDFDCTCIRLLFALILLFQKTREIKRLIGMKHSNIELLGHQRINSHYSLVLKFYHGAMTSINWAGSIHFLPFWFLRVLSTICFFDHLLRALIP
jgi:hypothetical protein